MSEISVIGCGLMGSALVRTLAKGGSTLTIWNRTRQKAEALVQSGVTGVTVADSVGAALEASPWTIFNIANCADCLTLLEPEQSRLRDKIIIELTTGTPNEARRLGRPHHHGRWTLSGRGGHWLSQSGGNPPAPDSVQRGPGGFCNLPVHAGAARWRPLSG